MIDALVTTVDGRDVEFAQAGTGPDLVLLPSLLTELTVFERVAPLLAANRRITCLNLPGYGASAPRELGSVADHADHVAAAIAALGLAPPVDLFGNGFGAFVALQVAIRHGPQLARLLVADVVPAFPEPARVPFRTMAEKVRAGGMQAVLDTAIGRMFPPAFQAAEPTTVQQRKRRLATADVECFARACLALAELDLAPLLPRIGNRTLVLCGALDQTTPPTLAREVADAIAGAVFVEIADSGHCPMLEQPQALAAAVQTFLGATA